MTKSKLATASSIEVREAFERISIESLQNSGLKWQLFPSGPVGNLEWSPVMEGMISMWLAEMDFPIAEPLTAALRRRLATPYFGYTAPSILATSVAEVFARRAKRIFDWNPDISRIQPVSDTLQGIALAVGQFSAPGDGIVVQTPAYPSFLTMLSEMNRELIPNDLAGGPNGFEIDFDHLQSIPAERARILLVCNPHNPTGRVFQRNELESLARVALAKGWLVVCDEVHAELTYPGARHIPMDTLGAEIRQSLVTVTSPNKSFNIPGIGCAVLVSGTTDIQRRLFPAVRSLIGRINTLAAEATVSAWQDCDQWLGAVQSYLEENRSDVRRWVTEHLPGVKYFEPEGSYFSWFDFRPLKLAPTPQSYLCQHAKVILEPGWMFGPSGVGFARLSFATNKSILHEALRRIQRALEDQPE